MGSIANNGIAIRDYSSRSKKVCICKIIGGVSQIFRGRPATWRPARSRAPARLGVSRITRPPNARRPTALVRPEMLPRQRRGVGVRKTAVVMGRTGRDATARRSSSPRNSATLIVLVMQARFLTRRRHAIVDSARLLPSGVVAVPSFVMCPGVPARRQRTRPRCSPLCLRGFPLRRRSRHATMSMAAVTRDHAGANVAPPQPGEAGSMSHRSRTCPHFLGFSATACSCACSVRTMKSKFDGIPQSIITSLVFFLSRTGWSVDVTPDFP